MLGSHHPDPGVWHSLWYYEDGGIFLIIYLHIYIWEVMEPRAFEKCQMHFSTNQDDDDDDKSDNDNNRTVHRT